MIINVITELYLLRTFFLTEYLWLLTMAAAGTLSGIAALFFNKLLSIRQKKNELIKFLFVLVLSFVLSKETANLNVTAEKAKPSFENDSKETVGAETAIDISTGDPNQDKFDPIILNKARKYNIDPFLLKALIAVESSFNPEAVSYKGAQGLTQLMPATAKELGVKNSFDPEQNIDGAAKHLRNLINRYGSVRSALAYYYSGNVWRIRPGIEVGYIEKINTQLDRLKGDAVSIEDCRYFHNEVVVSSRRS